MRTFMQLIDFMFSLTSSSVENITRNSGPSSDQLLEACSQSSSESSGSQSTSSTVVSETNAALSSHTIHNMAKNAAFSPNQFLGTCSQSSSASCGIQNAHQNQNSNQNQFSASGFQPNGGLFSQPSFLRQNIAAVSNPNPNNMWPIPNTLYEKMFREFMFEHANARK